MIYLILYILALVAANLLVSVFGPWFSIINAFVLIGLDLTLRDKIHDQWDGKNLTIKMLGLILVAGGISYLLNPATGQIALASVCAFCLAMGFDSYVYQKLKSKSWFVRANGSNVAGAAVDSIAFPTIAFGGLMFEIVAMQFAAKVVGGYLWTKVIK